MALIKKALLAAALLGSCAFSFDMPKPSLGGSFGGFQRPNFFEKPFSAMKGELDYGLMLGSSFSYSSGADSPGLSTKALSSMTYSYKESLKIEGFLGYSYRPLMQVSHDAFGNPLEQGNFIGGARLSWTPSDSFLIEAEYGYTDRDFLNMGAVMGANAALSEELLQNSFSLLMHKKFKNKMSFTLITEFHNIDGPDIKNDSEFNEDTYR